MAPRSDLPPDAPDKNSPNRQATPSGPSWGLMVFLIFLAIGIAFVIAWAFVTPLLHRHF